MNPLAPRYLARPHPIPPALPRPLGLLADLLLLNLGEDQPKDFAQQFCHSRVPVGGDDLCGLRDLNIKLAWTALLADFFAIGRSARKVIMINSFARLDCNSIDLHKHPGRTRVFQVYEMTE